MKEWIDSYKGRACTYPASQMVIAKDSVEQKMLELTKKVDELQDAIDKVCYMYHTFNHAATPEQMLNDAFGLLDAMNILLEKESK